MLILETNHHEPKSNVAKKCIAANWMLKSHEASQVYPASRSSLLISKSSLPKIQVDKPMPHSIIDCHTQILP